MIDWFALVATLILTLTPYHGDKEDPAAREVRSHVLGRAMVQMVDYASCTGDFDGDKDCRRVVRPEHKIALLARLIAIGFYESGFARHVHEGRCRVAIGECDGGRARSPWQFQRVPPVYGVRVKEFWYAYRGADQKSTDGAAYAAALMLYRGFENCGTWEGAIAQYATGSACKWSHAAGRERLGARLEREIGELLEDAEAAEEGEDDCGE